MDNFGILWYVFIWYGGVDFGMGNEINGFFFGGVGSGMII